MTREPEHASNEISREPEHASDEISREREHASDEISREPEHALVKTGRRFFFYPLEQIHPILCSPSLLSLSGAVRSSGPALSGWDTMHSLIWRAAKRPGS